MSTAGKIFSIVWLILSVPVFLLFIRLFWKKSTVQPIKARVPSLVIMSDLVLMVWTIFLCIQRIAEGSYPCWLNFWSGLLGVILLGNLYLARCVFLYINFRVQRLDEMLAVKETPWTKFIKTFSNQESMNRLMLVANSVLIIPGIVITAVVDGFANGTKGDECDIFEAQTLLWIYTGIYLLLFIYMSSKIRDINDYFRIKRELVITSVSAVMTLTLWFCFNGNNKLEETNETDFPVSTLSVLVGIMIAFHQSTIWPVYRAYLKPVKVPGSHKDGQLIEEDISIHTILADKDMTEGFMNFLILNFAVECLSFYQGVGHLYEYIENEYSRPRDMLRACHEISGRFLVENAPLRVPDDCVSQNEVVTLGEQLCQLESHLEEDGEGDLGTEEYRSAIREMFEPIEEAALDYLSDEWLPQYLHDIQQVA